MKALKLLGVAMATAGLVGMIAPDALANKNKDKNNGNGNGKSQPANTTPTAPPTATTPPAPAPSQPTSANTTPPAPAPSQSTADFACSGGSVTSNPLAGGSSLSYSQCMTASGNDVSGSIATDLSKFLDSTLGKGDWVFDGKYEKGKNESGPNDYGFSWVQTSDGSGTWSLAETVTTPFVISLKAGPAYTAYYFDGSGSFNSGTWATFDQKDLSHASFFVGKGGLTPEPPNATVPEPASAAALALVGLSAIGLRRKQQA